MADTSPKNDKNYSRSEMWENNIFNGLSVVLIGLIFLLNTTGNLSWDIWRYIFHFWPLIFVIIGLNILLDWTRIGRIISSALSFLIFLFVIFLGMIAVDAKILQNINIPQGLKDFALTARGNVGKSMNKFYSLSKDDYKDIQKINTNIKLGEGKITIEDNSAELFTINADYFEKYGDFNVDTKQEKNNLNINLTNKENNNITNAFGDLKYAINLGTNDLKHNLTLDFGAGDNDINLQNNKFETLEVNIGAGVTHVKLAEKNIDKLLSAKFKIGAGNMTMDIPRDIGYKIDYKVGVGSIKVNDEQIGKIGDKDKEYISNNYSTATNVINITVEVGVGDFRLNTY